TYYQIANLSIRDLSPVNEKAPEGARSRVNGSRMAVLHRSDQFAIKIPEDFTVHPTAPMTA
ncbi:MAG: hypothetical protein SO135_07800, partial [Sphaerochaetaceae bacterium]|nr:hypothetical protein [Sphaerochaetaceae bacterium]